MALAIVTKASGTRSRGIDVRAHMAIDHDVDSGDVLVSRA